MKKLHRLVSMFIVAALFIGTMVSVNAAPASIRLLIDGTEIASDVKPVLENGTTLVPVRVAAETLGAEVKWDAPKRQVTVESAGYTVVFTVDSKTYTVNGASKTLENPAKIISGRTMIPIRALAEAMEAQVNYDSKTKTAYINYFTTMKGSIKVSGSTTVTPILQTAVDKLTAMNEGLSITVSGGGSGAGIKDTQMGANNVGMSSRELTSAEASTLHSFVIARDGIAVIVHPSNPVTKLTLDQARKIFMGEIKNWKDVGGNTAPILVQTRETGSGTLATLEEMLLNKKQVVSTATPHASSALVKQAVANSQFSIGFDSIGFVDKTVKAVSLDGVFPRENFVIDGSYIMSRNLLVFTKNKPDGTTAKLIDYLRSEACQQEVVRKEGYVPFR